MPTYKLHYFPLRARAEAIRYLFAEAGVKYEDIRISFEDWPKNKQKMPFRQMPVLEVDGKQLSQSYTIVRYLANEFGLAGKSKWEAAEADQFAGVVEDIFLPNAQANFEKDEKRKAEILKKLKEETIPNCFQGIEAALAKNRSGFLVGNGVTYADFVLLGLEEILDVSLKDDMKAVLAPYPNIQKHRQKIQSLPKIAAWIKKRPESNV